MTDNQTRAAARLHKAEVAREVSAQQPRRRRTLSGRTVPQAKAGRTWHEFIAPGRGATGGASSDPKHPSRKHDVIRPSPVLTLAKDVPARQVGQARRRDRRNLTRRQQRHYMVSGSHGGNDYTSLCACGAFFSAPTDELLRQVTALHYPVAA